MNKKLFLSIGALLCLSACNLKTYWLPGALDTGGVFSQCAGLPALDKVLSLRANIDELVSESLNTENEYELRQILTRLEIETSDLKAILAPEYTNQIHDVTYSWSIQNQFLANGMNVFPENFSVFGVNLNLTDLHILPQSTTTEITLNRKASLLEICALSGTVQGLYAIGITEENPIFYYRLYVQDVK